MRRRFDSEQCEIDPLEDYNYETEKKRKNSIHSVSPVVGVIFIILLVGLYEIVYLLDGILPKPLKLIDEKNNPDAFITERTQHNLKLLTDIGPRIAGSRENEVLAVDLLKQEIELIQEQAHTNQILEMDVQTVSGSYFIDFKPHGAINAYGNVQNVLVKLYSKHNSTHSLLVNCHFDSVPTSPGGSDDGINCVTMLEVLRKLSRLPEPPQHNIIFLFNGAEETPLQASHGFITQHKWAKEVGVFINLEAAGAGGKEVLFQAGPNRPWLMDYYKKVARPHGQAAGEELFQSGLIPSDTDFRNFRDFGGAIGLDFAFARNSYRYHTKYDDFRNIPLGSYQHVGDNILFLIRNLANAPELANPKGQPTGKTIFYDFFALFMICYSERTAIMVNVLVSLMSLIISIKAFYDFGLGFSYRSLIHHALTIGAILLGWILGITFSIIMALLLDGLKFSMSWYNNPWMVFGLYSVPVVLCSCAPVVLLNHYNDQHKLSIGPQAQVQMHLVRSIWTLPLLLGTFFGLRFVYVILIPVIFSTLVFAVVQLSSLQHSIRKWQFFYILGTIIPTMFLMQQSLEIVGVLIPTCGRMGPNKNPEIIIGILVSLVTTLITSFYVPFITLVRKPTTILKILTGTFLLVFVIVFTPLGFPYNGNPDSPAPQRFWIYHTSRTFRNEANVINKQDAGFFLLNQDRNSPKSVEKYVKDLSKAESIAQDCNERFFCGFASSKMIAIQSNGSVWIPAEEPSFHERMNLKLNSKTSISNTVTRFDFTSTGPSRQAIYISPRTNVTLVGTNLVPELPTNTITWNGRPTYIILYTWAKVNTPLTFTLDFETPAKWTGPTFDIALEGKYVDDKLNVKTPHYIEFLSEFPKWADVTAWLSAFESWVY